MIKSPTYEKHFISLAAVFILGDSVIDIPGSSADEKTIIGFLAAAAITFLLYCIGIPIVRGLLRSRISKTSSFKIKFCITVLFTGVSVYALWNAATSFKGFIRFVNINLLPDTPSFYVTIILCIVIAVLGGKRQGVLLKFSLIAFWAITVAILIFFALSANQFDFRNILFYNIPSFKAISAQTYPYIRRIVFPALLIPVYQAVVFKQSKAFGSFTGLGCGLLLLGLCILNSVLIFGPQLSAKLNFPYASAISTVTIGQLFTRMDGFSYFIYFAASVIKITVCIDIVVGLLRKTDEIFASSEKIQSVKD